MGQPFWDVIVDPETGELGDLVGYEEVEENNPWFILHLDGQRVPGRVDSLSIEPKIRIDVSKRTGSDGGPTIEKGHEAARIQIVMKIWTPEQWAAWQVLKERIWRAPGQKLRTRDAEGTKKPTGAVAIEHPACGDARIEAVLFESIGAPEPAPEPQARLIRMRAVQYIADLKQSTERKVVGKAPLAGAIVDAKNGIPPKTPAQTQATARPRLAPNQGGSGIP